MLQKPERLTFLEECISVPSWIFDLKHSWMVRTGNIPNEIFIESAHGYDLTLEEAVDIFHSKGVFCAICCAGCEWADYGNLYVMFYGQISFSSLPDGFIYGFTSINGIMYTLLYPGDYDTNASPSEKINFFRFKASQVLSIAENIERRRG